MTLRTNRSTLRPLAALLPLLAVLFLAVAPQAQAQQDAAQPAAQAPAQAKGKPGPRGERGDYTKPENVEKHIADLRAKLTISPAQEAAWNDLAKAMRDNAARMRTLIENWRKKDGAANAVDRLKMHGEMADEHAQAMRGLIPAFEKLYGMLSEEQKKIADEAFSHRMGKGKRQGR